MVKSTGTLGVEAGLTEFTAIFSASCCFASWVETVDPLNSFGDYDAESVYLAAMLFEFAGDIARVAREGAFRI